MFLDRGGRRRTAPVRTPGLGGGRSIQLLPSSIEEHHPLSLVPIAAVRSKKTKTARIDDPAVKKDGMVLALAVGLYVRGLAPYDVEPRLSRVRSRLDIDGAW